MHELVSASAGQVLHELGALAVHAVPRRLARRCCALALDVALPPLCPSCRAPLGDGVGLCAACWSKLSLIEPPYCARLGIPFAYDPGPGLLSMEAIANPPAYDRARAAVRYDDVARALVTSFKYGDRLDLAPMMGRWMARAGRELLGRCRRAAAGAAALAQAVGAALQPVGGAGAARSRTYAACRCCMARSSACARRRSRSACRRPSAPTTCRAPSACRRRKRPQVAGRRLVLIDDVLTSGATVDTCARALLRAGAAHVDVLVFARVVAPVRTPI